MKQKIYACGCFYAINDISITKLGMTQSEVVKNIHVSEFALTRNSAWVDILKIVQ